MKKQSQTDEWFTLHEAAAETGVCYETLRRLFISGLLPGRRLGFKKGKILLPRRSVERVKKAYDGRQAQ